MTTWTKCCTCNYEVPIEQIIQAITMANAKTNPICKGCARNIAIELLRSEIK